MNHSIVRCASFGRVYTPFRSRSRLALSIELGNSLLLFFIDFLSLKAAETLSSQFQELGCCSQHLVCCVKQELTLLANICNLVQAKRTKKVGIVGKYGRFLNNLF